MPSCIHLPAILQALRKKRQSQPTSNLPLCGFLQAPCTEPDGRLASQELSTTAEPNTEPGSSAASVVSVDRTVIQEDILVEIQPGSANEGEAYAEEADRARHAALRRLVDGE